MVDISGSYPAIHLIVSHTQRLKLLNLTHNVQKTIKPVIVTSCLPSDKFAKCSMMSFNVFFITHTHSRKKNTEKLKPTRYHTLDI